MTSTEPSRPVPSRIHGNAGRCADAEELPRSDGGRHEVPDDAEQAVIAFEGRREARVVTNEPSGADLDLTAKPPARQELAKARMESRCGLARRRGEGDDVLVPELVADSHGG